MATVKIRILRYGVVKHRAEVRGQGTQHAVSRWALGMPIFWPVDGVSAKRLKVCCTASLTADNVDLRGADIMRGKGSELTWVDIVSYGGEITKLT